MYEVRLINDGKETIIHSPYFNDLKLIDGSIKLEVNIADGFNFTILPDNPGYYLIRPFKTLVNVYNLKTQKYEFEGRILMESENMSEQGEVNKTVQCESELAYLNDSAQRHGEYHNISVRDFLQIIINNHNRDIASDDIDKTFRLGTVEVDSSTGELYRYLGYENTMDTIKDKLIDRLGGELRVRKENGVRYLDYLNEGSQVKQTEIRLSKNLKSITKEVDPTEIITRLVPLGERIESEDEEATDASEARLTIESVNDGKDYLIDEEMENAIGTVIVKSEAWDDITQPNILKTRGQQFLRDNNRIKVQYQITALDLSLIDLDVDSFEIGNYYPVINPIMGINEPLRVVGKTIDIINPNQNALNIGDQFKKASDYQRDAILAERKIIDLESITELQRKRITEIKNEVVNVESNLQNLQQVIDDADLEELPDAITALEQAINDLNDALDNIPVYDVATHTQDGLMASTDKIKMDLINVTRNIDLDTLKNKLDLLTVTQSIDLDQLYQDVQDLKNS